VLQVRQSKAQLFDLPAQLPALPRQAHAPRAVVGQEPLGIPALRSLPLPPLIQRGELLVELRAQLRLAVHLALELLRSALRLLDPLLEGLRAQF
jgi:hypothetical protein